MGRGTAMCSELAQVARARLQTPGTTVYQGGLCRAYA